MSKKLPKTELARWELALVWLALIGTVGAAITSLYTGDTAWAWVYSMFAVVFAVALWGGHTQRRRNRATRPGNNPGQDT